MDDLFQALNMFKSGVKDLQTSRVIQGANEQVQQIRSSEADEAQKRQALTSLSQNLVAQMGALGAPVSDIQQQAANVGPKQFANSNAMNAEAVLTGNKALGSEAAKQQSFENNKAFTLAQMKLAARLDPVQNAKASALQDERFAKHLTGLDKSIDTQTTRFGNIANLQKTNNTIADARSLLEGDITNLNLAEVAKTMDRILSGSAPTIAGTQEVAPHTLEQWRAKTKEYITSKPEKVNLPEFKEFYKKTLNRIEQINNGIIKGAQKSKLASATSIAKLNPDGFKIYAESRGFKADVDSKTGKISLSDIEQAAQQAPAQPPMQTVMVRDKSTGQMIKAMRGPDGKLYKAE